MVRASRNASNRGFHSHAEKAKGFGGSIKAHLTTEQHLPFGYCCLCLKPAIDPVVSPSGHIYEKEVILQYILTKTQELKKQTIKNPNNNNNLVLINKNEDSKQEEDKFKQKQQEFMNKADCIANKNILKEDEKSYQTEERSKLIDDTDNEKKQVALKHANPFMPQFQPSSSTITPKNTSKQRPSSPMSGKPIRSKELISLNIEKETKNDDIRVVCSVSKKTITSQKVIVIKSTGILMLKSVYIDLKLNESLQCPVTNKKFKKSDVIELVRAGSGFAGCGTQVEAKVWRPGIN